MAQKLSSVPIRPAGLRDEKAIVRSWRVGTAVILLLLIAFSLRVRNLGVADLTFDEVATFFVAHRPLLEVIRYVMGAAREHPPVYYLFMHIWMRLAGTSEYALRLPSVLVSVLAVSWSYKFGRRLPGRYGALWSALLFALVPFHIWAGRTGRMYALVLLLSLIVMDSWLRWLTHPDWRHWLGFVMLSAVAVMTHYYLALLWPAQGLVLLLLPQRTRKIRMPWFLTLVGVGVCMSGFVMISPGIRAMMLEVARRFPYRGFRASELGIVFTDLYIWGFRPELVWIGVVGLVLTFFGWVTLIWRNRVMGMLVAAWGIVPLILAHMVPERLEPRYLTPIFAALLFGFAALLSRLRLKLLQFLSFIGLVGIVTWRLPLFYEKPDVTFSTRVETLHAAAQPGDALLMNGPWPSLLLNYYRAPEYLSLYKVPEEAPPGYEEIVDEPRLEKIFEKHHRVWVSYGAIHWADPDYSVSRWLAENAYRVFDRAGMVLYLSSDGAVTKTVVANLDFGVRLQLVEAAVDRYSAMVGQPVRIKLDFEGDALDKGVGATIGLLDADGSVWQQSDTHFGPFHQPNGLRLPDRWTEQRGLLLLPGLPPGEYTLAIRVEGEGISTTPATYHGWVPLTKLKVDRGAVDSDLIALLPQPTVKGLSFGKDLTLVGVEPYADNVMQGYPTGFDVWWRTEHAVTARDLYVRLLGPETWLVGTYPLGPDFYLPSCWFTGDVVRQRIFFQLPDALTAGTYQVQLHIKMDADFPEDNTWITIFTFSVEARHRIYAPPLFRSRQDVVFGDVLRLRGYQLTRDEAHPGDRVDLTVYWQALENPTHIYAVFNHLRADDGFSIWQGDSWPQAGIYTTNYWQKNEVVAEQYTIEIPSDTPPGIYALYTGVYDPVTGTRLRAMTQQGDQLVNDEWVLLHLMIKPR